MINENKSENNRIPEHTGQLPSGENGGLGTTYLEINITKQSCIAPTKTAKTIFLDK